MNGGLLKTKQNARRHRRCKELRRKFANFVRDLCSNHLSQKLSGICTLRLRCSMCHRHLRAMPLPPFSPSLRVPYYVRFLVYHFIPKKNHKRSGLGAAKPSTQYVRSINTTCAEAPHISCEGLVPFLKLLG